MTSFERFQRNARSKISCDGRSSKHSRMMEDRDPRLGDVTFSNDVVRFMCNPQKNYFSKTILMKNESGFKIYFKVRSNNPKNYVVSPYEQVIDHQQKINLKFQFSPTLADLSAYKRDKFQIIWGKLPSYPGLPTEFSQSVKLPVEIIMVDGDNDFESVDENGHFTQQSYGSSYTPSINRNLSSSRNNENKNHDTLLTKPIMIGVAVVSFLVGFLAG